MGEAPSPHVVMLVRNRYTHDTRVEKEVRTLVGAGYRVTVLADPAPGLPVHERRDGATIERVAPRGRLVPGLRFLAHQLHLARRLRRHRPDILHAHDTNALVPVTLVAARLRRPFVYDAHDLWTERPRRERGRLYWALSQAWFRLVERLCIPRAAATITVSPPIVEHLRSRFGLQRVALVANYPDWTGAVAPRDLRALPGAEALDPQLPVALYLGGLMAGRGLEELIDAVGLVPEVQLVLLGEGVHANRLRARVIERGLSSRIHFLPPVASDDVVEVAASADLGVSPIVDSCLNYRYSLPNKLFQYLAAGVPVVASDFPQVRDVVEGSGAGIVVDTSDPRRIADGIRLVLADPAEARRMGARGREAVAERFNWDASARNLLEVYRALPK
jgi:glycosyltransferase involved in cell wall biosynthesis